MALTSAQLTTLFASAIALAAATSGCGPCRSTSYGWEKVVLVEEEELEGSFDYTHCHELCDNYPNECSETDVEGDPAVVCVYETSLDCGGVGRIPAGLEPSDGQVGDSALGRYFARVAHLEAASVHAFQQLRRELIAHGAPEELLTAASAAERDEVRHAALMGGLARRFGAIPAKVRVAPLAIRSLQQVALDNAVEGCVRETMGAAVASWQAQHAADAQVRKVMARVATDETRHAALSWAVHQWAMARLSASERAAVERAAHGVAHALPCRAPEPEVARLAGLPSAAVQRSLVETLGTALWGLAA